MSLSNAPASDRLEEVLATCCHQMDALLLGDLVTSIKAGGLVWFIAEFARAIRDDAFTPRSWGVLIHTDLDDEDTEQLDKDLRYVWSQVAPDRPYPGDER